MPCQQCENGMWRWGESGECRYETREECEQANEGKDMRHQSLPKLSKPKLQYTIPVATQRYRRVKLKTGEVLFSVYLADDEQEPEHVIDVSGIVGDWFDMLDAATMVGAIREADSPIRMRLNTPGGSAFDALDVYNALIEHPHKVTADIIQARSAGSLLASAADERNIMPTAPFMIHRAWSGFLLLGNSEEVRAQIPQLEADIKSLEKLDLGLAGILADRSGKTVKEVHDLLVGEEGVDGTEFVGQEAIDAGFADNLIQNKKAQNRRLDTAMNRAIGIAIRKRKFQQTGVAP